MLFKYFKRIPWKIFNEYLFQFRNLTYKTTKRQKLLEKRYQEIPLYQLNTVTQSKVLHNMPRKTKQKLILHCIFSWFLKKSHQLKPFKEENLETLFPWICLPFPSPSWKNKKNLRIVFLFESQNSFDFCNRPFSKKNLRQRIYQSQRRAFDFCNRLVSNKNTKILYQSQRRAFDVCDRPVYDFFLCLLISLPFPCLHYRFPKGR